MQANQNTDTSDPGRTIGNGVVLAYGAVAAAITFLAWKGKLEPMLSLGVLCLLFMVLFVGDIMIQREDMHGNTFLSPTQRGEERERQREEETATSGD